MSSTILVKIRCNSLCHRLPLTLPLSLTKLHEYLYSIYSPKLSNHTVNLFVNGTRIQHQADIDEIVQQHTTNNLVAKPLIIDVTLNKSKSLSLKLPTCVPKSTTPSRNSNSTVPSAAEITSSSFTNVSHPLPTESTESTQSVTPHSPTSMPFVTYQELFSLFSRMNALEKKVEDMNYLLKYSSKEVIRTELESLQISVDKPCDDILMNAIKPTHMSPISPDNCGTLDPLALSIASHIDIQSSNLSLDSLDLSSSSSSSSILTNDSADIDLIGSSTVREILSSSGPVVENLIWSTLSIEHQSNDVSIDSLQTTEVEQLNSNTEEHPMNSITHHRRSSLNIEDMEESIDLLSEHLDNQDSRLAESTESLGYVEVSPRSSNELMYSVSENSVYECKDVDDDYISLLNSTSQSFSVDPKYEQHLEVLSASGFQNRKINLALLEEYDGNVEEVESALRTYNEMGHH